MSLNPLELLRETYCVAPSPAVAPFVDHFRRVFGEALAAVVFYGSKLDDQLATDTSFFDFYLICDDYRRFYRRRRDRWLASFLPPNIYYLELERPAGGKSTCKYCVISLADLKKHVAPDAKDFYHLGRFSKRLAVIWWREPFERDEVLGACYQAMETLTPHALNKVGAVFTLPELIRRALALSYEGEVRLEKTDEKVEALYRIAEPFYRAIWAHLLEQYRAFDPELFRPRLPEDDPETYYLRRPASQHAAQLRETAALIRRSRRRAKARWPKSILLTDNWVDILLAKVERTYGVKLELTPRERRWVLILGWRHFFRLRREGKIR